LGPALAVGDAATATARKIIPNLVLVHMIHPAENATEGEKDRRRTVGDLSCFPEIRDLLEAGRYYKLPGDRFKSGVFRHFAGLFLSSSFAEERAYRERPGG
jgi:hypothetical protein